MSDTKQDKPSNPSANDGPQPDVKEDITHDAKDHVDDPAKELAQGKAGADNEHNMTLKQSIRLYPYAVAWSVAFSITIIMEGYDIILISSLMAQPAFQERFGSYYGEQLGNQISGPWQAGLANATGVGTIFGAFANGWLTQKFGYRKTLLSALVFVSGAIFITFFAQNLAMLCAGSFLCGLPWGVFAVMAPAYASEICPTVLRGYLANWICFCWAAGLLLAAGVQSALSTRMDEWAYKIPFAIQWAWPIPLLVVIWYAPESPWNLLRQGRKEEAEKNLRRLAAKDSCIDFAATLVMMEHTIQLERETDANAKYIDCFKGINLRRTEITCLVWVCQIIDGTVLTGTPTYFFVQAGLSASNAFNMSVGALGLSCVGVIISWVLIYHFGRRSLYLLSLASSLLCLVSVGAASAISESQQSSYFQASIVLVNALIRFATIGPVCYAIMSEISAVTLRSKTLSLARISYYLVQIVCNTINPYMINPTEGNWKGKAGFFWAGTCGIMLVWAFFRLPETKDRTFQEIDLLFSAKTPARKFKGAKVDPYSECGDKIVDAAHVERV